MAYHFVFGWLFTINGVLYVLYTAVSGEWRHLVPDRHALKESVQVTLHDLGLRKELPPQGRYNAAQRLTYSGIVAMGAGSVLTGPRHLEADDAGRADDAARRLPDARGRSTSS